MDALLRIYVPFSHPLPYFKPFYLCHTTCPDFSWLLLLNYVHYPHRFMSTTAFASFTEIFYLLIILCPLDIFLFTDQVKLILGGFIFVNLWALFLFKFVPTPRYVLKEWKLLWLSVGLTKWDDRPCLNWLIEPTNPIKINMNMTCLIIPFRPFKL